MRKSSTKKLALNRFLDALTSRERKVFDRLDTPMKIQEYLDETPYNVEDRYYSALSVLRQRRAHCFDGACFAAMALWRLGQPPRLLEMLPWDDDGHVIAVFQRGRAFGAVGKSNFSGLRYREPVYRDVRELLMSYYEPYFNLARSRTLRGYTEPLDLRAFDHVAWATDDAAMYTVADGLDAGPRVRLFTAAQIRAFSKVDKLTYETNLSRANPAGLRKPDHR